MGMSKQSFTPSEPEKKQSVEHIFYELQMLLDCRVLFENAAEKYRQASNVQDQMTWSATQNAIIESFLLHFRNLKQFLDNKQYPNDVKARDYAPAWLSDPALADAAEDTRVNRKLAHLSYDRVGGNRGWNLEPMEKRICTVFQKFLGTIEVKYHPLFACCRTKLSAYGY
jgi:hypothetical protein